MSGGRSARFPAERAIRVTTVVAVATVAIVAAFVSYRHMRGVAMQHGEDPMSAAVLPFSVDGLIVAASMAMLADRRAGRSRSWLPYLLLVLGACASLVANVLHAEPTFTARIIAGWPPLALLGSYELLMRQIHPAGRRTAGVAATVDLPIPPQRGPSPEADDETDRADGASAVGPNGAMDAAAKREAIAQALDLTGGSATETVAMLASLGITVSKSWVYQVRRNTPHADHNTGPSVRPAHRPTVRGRRRGMAGERTLVRDQGPADEPGAGQGSAA
ncbi:DUF2637 domain-containing protein [Frankia sp. AiPa1]|uniref:DUF2637 domain-containing protein n=1 Tax=Frankia sp. AiPa1 TaxID=573492 RepID=UPI00202B762D|nr:DUF2637 domain-containing protein [Frankia sp. AiPa1]MCL9762741.1 DUF2637 domain-containing protein [Frankia sp. AiPa1]